MALPKLSGAVPKYDVTIPSTGEETRFRPFLVKEEKVLLIALESEEPKQISHAVLDIIKSCIEEGFDTTKLTGADVEYLFLKIRSKSVGETIDLSYKCYNCDTANDVQIAIDDIEMNGVYPKKTLELTDSIHIEMAVPKFVDMQNIDLSEAATATDAIFALIKEACISVVTDDERIMVKEESLEEFTEFLESMSAEQFGKIRGYVEGLPKLTHNLKFTCTNCGTENETKLEGLQSFFS